MVNQMLISFAVKFFQNNIAAWGSSYYVFSIHVDQLIRVFLVHPCIGKKLNFTMLVIVNIGASDYGPLAYC